MTTVTKIPLSASSNGAGIKVIAASTPGTLIHTATSASGSCDEIWLWAYNADDANAVISIEWGSDTELPRKVPVPLQTGLVPVIPGLILQAGQTVRVFSSATNMVKMDGFVNRITN